MFVITGGGSGIGAQLAMQLARRGKSVCIVGRREEALMKTAAFSTLISTCVADVASESGRQKIVDCLKEVEQIEGLVHNAGLIRPMSLLLKVEKPAWDAILATNLSAPLFLSQLLLPKLQDGRVLHIGSGVAHFPVLAWGPYCVSKAALWMLTRCWQLESQDTAFASVMPGIVDTDMQVLIRQSAVMDAEKKTFFLKLKQEGRLLDPETVALFLTWLLLDLDTATYVSKEWDIYDKTHHAAWVSSPHVVPDWE